MKISAAAFSVPPAYATVNEFLLNCGADSETIVWQTHDRSHSVSTAATSLL